MFALIYAVDAWAGPQAHDPQHDASVQALADVQAFPGPTSALDLPSALSRVDWLSWAASPSDLARWRGEALAEGGLFAASLNAASRGRLETLHAATLYAVEGELVELPAGRDQAILQLREAIVYTNPSQEPLGGLALRVFGNGQDLRHDRARIQGVWVDNQPAKFSLDATLLSVELPRPLPPGASTRILLHLVQDIPKFDPSADGTEEIHPEATGAFGRADGTINLGHWLPLVTPTDRRGRFDIRPLRSNTEHAMFDPALFHVVLHVPSHFTVATTGVELHRGDELGQATVIAAAAGVRSFAVELVGRSQILEEEVAGTRLRVITPSSSPEMGHHLLSYAKGALEVFSARFGPLDQAEIDLVEAPLAELLAIEHPGLIAIDLTHDDVPISFGPVQRGQPIPMGNTDIEWAIVHELGHQWWGFEVGNDPALSPWLDESLASNAAAVYWLDRHGQAALDARYQRDVFDRWIQMRRHNVEDLPVDQPAWKYNLEQLAGIVLGRGEIFFDKLRVALGDEPYFSALRMYRSRFQGHFATAEDLIDCFVEAADTQGIDPLVVTDLYERWIREAHGYEDLLPVPR